MKTNASRERAQPHGAVLAPSRSFGDLAAAPASAGHHFGRVAVTAPETGTGTIQPMMPGGTPGGSGQEEDDRRSKRPRVDGLAAITAGYASSSDEEDEDENPAPVPRSTPSTTTSTVTAGASAPHPATSTAAMRVPATLLPRGSASSVSSRMIPRALLVSPASAPRPAATPIPRQAPSAEPSQSASSSSGSLTNADLRAMLHSSSGHPSASFDWWNAEATDFQGLDDSTLADVHQSLATGQKRIGSGNRFGIHGVANRVDESRDFAGDPGHHHATWKTQKKLGLAVAEMDRRKLPVSDEARKWAAAPITNTCKPPSTPRKREDPRDPGGSARAVMKRKIETK